MPPKANSGKAKAPAIEETEILQAILLADSFDKRFEPLTVTTPRCLLPVCNVTLLEWTFECLAAAGVDKVFVVARSHTDQIDAAIKESSWSKEDSGMEISIVKVPRETICLGDAMRDIYNRKLITSDFLLVHGDLVSNVRVDEVVNAFKKRFEASKDNIMTMLLKESGPEHRTRPRGDSSIFVVDPVTSECVYYDSVPGLPVKTHASIPRTVFEKHFELEIRNDLIDCGIDVCAFEVMSLFEDNFDWEHIRKDFLHGVLSSDILMKNIHCHIISDGYAARVRDTKSYDAISKDILSRWTFPMVPDDNMPGPSGGYALTRNLTYLSLSSPPLLARTAEVGPLALLGPRASVAADAKVVRSVLGPRCTVGAGAVVSDSYLWEGVVVEAGAVVESSILGKGVVVKKGSMVERGCLVGDGVVLGPEASLAEFSRVSRRGLRAEVADDEDEDEDDDDAVDFEEMEAAQTEDMRRQVGMESNGIIWPTQGSPEDDEDDEDDEDEDEETSNTFSNLRLGRIGDPGSDLELSDSGSNSDSDAYDSDASTKRKRRTSTSSLSSFTISSSCLNPAVSAVEREFRLEAHATLVRAFSDGHRVADCAAELKTLRLATNAPWRAMHEVVVRTVADEVKVLPAESGAAAQSKEIARVVVRWGPLISTIAGSEPVDTISILQEHCARSARLGLFGQMLASFYQNDIVEDDDISAWHKLPASNPDATNEISENMRKCWTVGGKLLEHLEADSESEDEDEDSE
ncbi:nucleotide-diphospho-sugar transferase [Schizopora paradoxa]|uniref:Translation initiation factor eIF2B subunit epsilon n=1 Tax=Schizopora paradoxa TaxID=27342 RepID=A0A0H2RT31_9AGAM|nr:nucleotide-diphospho-sugar transferase [Schizopora paradoxa]